MSRSNRGGGIRASAAQVAPAHTANDKQHANNQRTQQPTPQQAEETHESPLAIMTRQVYLYLCQFGFDETAAQLKGALSERHVDIDEETAQEGRLRCSFYRIFKFTQMEDLYVSAELVLDDLLAVAAFADEPRTVDSAYFALDVKIRIQACINALEVDPTIFEETVEQYFPPNRVNPPANKKESADDVKRREVYKRERDALLAYRRHTNSKSAKDKALAKEYLKKFSPKDMELAVRSFILTIVSKLNMSGGVLLEKIASDLSKGKLPQYADPLKQRDVKVEQADDDVEMSSGEAQQPAEEAVEAEEEEEEEEAEEEEEESPPPPPVKRGRDGRPPKASAAATPVKQATPAKVAPAPKPTATPDSLPRRATRTNTPNRAVKGATSEAAKKLEEASKKLSHRGEDPIQQALAATASLSRAGKRKNPEPVESEEDEKATSAAGNRYDVASKRAEKIEFSDEDVELDERQAVPPLPSFQPKPTKKLKAAVPISVDDESEEEPVAAKTPVKKPGGKRAVALGIGKHVIDRSIQRIPFSQEEVEALTEGMKKYGEQKRKWALILHNYADRFHDRTAVDLKDKWRNLNKLAMKQGAGTYRGRGGRRKRPSEEEEEEVEEIESD